MQISLKTLCSTAAIFRLAMEFYTGFNPSAPSGELRPKQPAITNGLKKLTVLQLRSMTPSVLSISDISANDINALSNPHKACLFPPVEDTLPLRGFDFAVITFKDEADDAVRHDVSFAQGEAYLLRDRIWQHRLPQLDPTVVELPATGQGALVIILRHVDEVTEGIRRLRAKVALGVSEASNSNQRVRDTTSFLVHWDANHECLAPRDKDESQ